MALSWLLIVIMMCLSAHLNLAEWGCGRSRYENAGLPGGTFPSPSIINGWKARVNEFPWQVLLQIPHQSIWDRTLCGGSFLHYDWVLTAAHCVDNKDGKVPEKTKIFLGVSDRKHMADDVVTIDVKEIILHEEYDVALLRLDPAQKVSSYSDRYFPICMPTKKTENYDGDIVVLSGWGRIDKENMYQASNDLLYVTLPILDYISCLRCESVFYPEEICVGSCGTYNGGACHGDSGGPMVRKRDNGQWELLGVSARVGNKKCDSPSIYVDVYNILPWIQETTKNAALVS